MKRAKKTEIVTTAAALQNLVGRIGGEPLLAVDLEADSMHHYQEKVCLLQISTPSESVIVDPLLLDDLSPLAPVMADPGVRKVFHGADYDIRSLHRDFGIEVHNLFDTMIACQFLGERELGLAAVLLKRFGVELDKAYQKADWSKRPLSAEMIEYAVRDTSLLIELYGQLERELQAKGRLAWVEEESELLSGVRASVREAEPLFLRFKGASRFSQRRLAVLEELLRLRERLAREGDLPPFKIMGSDTVRMLAEISPRRASDLEGISGLSPKMVRRQGQQILDAVARGVSLPDEALPLFPSVRRAPKDKGKEHVVKRLKEWRESRAGQLGMEAGILINNNLLEAVADAAIHGKGAREVPMKQWQKALFGKEIARLVDNIGSVSASGGNV